MLTLALMVSPRSLSAIAVARSVPPTLVSSGPSSSNPYHGPLRHPLASCSSPLPSSRWSPSQQPRSLAFTGPRFEQTYIEYQPKPLSAMELIAKVPVTMVPGRKAVCDGGPSSLLEWLSLA